MQSKYYVIESSDGKESVYENDFYNLSINDNGNVSLDRKMHNPEVVKNPEVVTTQLMEDLARATVKMNTLMEAIKTLSVNGLVDDDYVQQFTNYIYNTQQESKKKKKARLRK